MTTPRLSHVHGVVGWVITAHRDRNLAFSLKELRAWNFLQSHSAAFPQYGKGVDNVNDTAGARAQEIAVAHSRATSMTRDDDDDDRAE